MVDFFIYFYEIMLPQKCSEIHTLKIESSGIRSARSNGNFLNLIQATLMELLSSEVEFRVRAD